jgi:hypothetical protein
MVAASTIHILDSLTVASWVLAGAAIVAIMIAITVNTFAAARQGSLKGGLSGEVRSLRLLTSHLSSLNRITISHPGRHTSQEVSKRRTPTRARRSSISAITWVAVVSIVSIILSVSVGIKTNQPAAKSTLPRNIVAVIEQENTISVLEKTSLAGELKLVSLNNGATDTVTVAAPDPNTAQSIAYNMMTSFGFSPSTYFGCLLDLWNRVSGWAYDAENASGAYGIPQALPGSRMASAGADWQTDPATQIRWGLGYIKEIYGNPCSAWAFLEANGYY